MHALIKHKACYKLNLPSLAKYIVIDSTTKKRSIILHKLIENINGTNAYRTLGRGRSKISRWLIVGIEPWTGRIRNLFGSPRIMFALSFSRSLEISSQPVRKTRIAPSPSWRQICSIVASTCKKINRTISYWKSNKHEDILQSRWIIRHAKKEFTV